MNLGSTMMWEWGIVYWAYKIISPITKIESSQVKNQEQSLPLNQFREQFFQDTNTRGK